MLKQWMDTVHNQNVFPERVKSHNVWQKAKDSHLRTYLEVHLLNSDQVFISIRLKAFPEFSGRTFFFFCL